jgi:cystathionine beta-lyase/cystathionine gamma-synthase
MSHRHPRTEPLVQPIYQTTTFALDDHSYGDLLGNDGLGVDWYTRVRNPTVDAASAAVAGLEGADEAVLTSSGMGAIATLALTLCHAGDRVVVARELYGDSYELFARRLPRLGIRVDLVDAADLDQWRAALAGSPVRLAYAETLSNPQLILLDIPAVAKLARGAGATFAVDNTFASPRLVRPLDHGADAVVNSVTKYLNGHSDVVAGAIAGPAELLKECRRSIMTFGTCLDPHAAFLILRGLRTFAVRLDRQMETAAAIAAWLEGMPEVLRVIHPTLDSFPEIDVARRLLPAARGGAMVSFVVAGGDERAKALMRSLSLAVEATSLGGVETLISAPHNSSHYLMSPEERTAIRIDPGMLRLSVGLEDPDELVADLAAALAQTAAGAETP